MKKSLVNNVKKSEKNSKMRNRKLFQLSVGYPEKRKPLNITIHLSINVKIIDTKKSDNK